MLEPRILLIDEPTSSLDPELTGEVLNVLRGLAADGVTMVIVTHEIGFAAQVSQHLVFLEGGRIVLKGRPEGVPAAVAAAAASGSWRRTWIGGLRC